MVIFQRGSFPIYILYIHIQGSIAITRRGRVYAYFSYYIYCENESKKNRIPNIDIGTYTRRDNWLETSILLTPVCGADLYVVCKTYRSRDRFCYRLQSNSI